MIINESGSRTLSVVTQNVLLDYKRTKNNLIYPQDERIASIAKSLTLFHGDLDVVGIQEAHKSEKQHNGEVLASELGFGPGFWVNHNQKRFPDSPRGRPGEYMGLFGSEVCSAESIDLGDKRRAMMTVIADVAFVTLHLRSGLDARTKRFLQAQKLDKALESYENAVIFGDFNEPPIRYVAKARDHLSESGFQSVFTLTKQRHPITSQVGGYKDVMSKNKGRNARFIRKGWSIDDILVRGPRIQTLGAGVLERVMVENGDELKSHMPREASDHEGVWATLKISNQL